MATTSEAQRSLSALSWTFAANAALVTLDWKKNGAMGNEVHGAGL
ncbi:hypothetical protein [Bradyrhizobium japonicum]|nr:hypothetical protein [Bradyrhizobium japonicum]